MPIKVFYHVCATGDGWEAIVRDQLNKLLFSGLYHQADVFACVSGEHAHDAAAVLARFGGRVSVLDVQPADASFERLTLLRMHDIVQPEDAVLYMHSKGVTKPRDAGVRDWRALMEYFLIGHCQSCLDALARADVVGVNFRHSPAPHFSGNFWWATGAHILRLPRAIGDGYFDPEFWVLSAGGTAVCVMDSAVDHYAGSFAPAAYVDRAWPPTRIRVEAPANSV